MPVRGKTLNCLKASYDRILKSEIITDLLKVIGCGIEMKGKSKNSDFDISNLNWNKIIICTDADEDGYQIRALLLTLFYRLLPSLIDYGRVYIAESPLFEITTSKDDIYFAYNESEKAAILAELDQKKQKYTVMRSKGLGENEPEMMWQTTMNPASRRLIKVCPTDAQKTAELLEMLLGDNIEARKEYIAAFGHLYAAQADV
jgi:DNA gyrase subunit B